MEAELEKRKALFLKKRQELMDFAKQYSEIDEDHLPKALQEASALMFQWNDYLYEWSGKVRTAKIKKNKVLFERIFHVRHHGHDGKGLSDKMIDQWSKFDEECVLAQDLYDRAMNMVEYIANTRDAMKTRYFTIKDMIAIRESQML